MWKIMHIADVHLERSTRWDEQRRAMAALRQHVTDRRPDVVCVVGDLQSPHSTRRLHPEERNEWRELFLHCRTAGASVVLVRGNHDPKGDGLHFVDVGVAYVETPQIVSFEDERGRLNIHCLPYPDAQDWLDGTEPAGERIATITRRVEEQALAWAEAADPRATNVLAYHGALRDAVIRVDEKSQPKVGAEPRPSVQAFSGFRAVLMGHYHLSQIIRPNDTCVAAYVGSPWPHTHGEEGQADKGVFEWTVGPTHVEEPRRLTLPYTRRLTYHLHYDGGLRWIDGTPFGSINGRAPSPVVATEGMVRDAIVRVVVRYPKGLADAISKEAIGAEFTRAGASVVTVHPSPEHDDRVRVEALASTHALPTLHDKLQAMWQAEGMPAGAPPAGWILDACAQLQAE